MENQRKDAVGLQPTEPDLLYQKPTNHARRMPMEQTQQEQFIIRRIGGTTYKVRVAFSETAAETILVSPFFPLCFKKVTKVTFT